MSHHKNINKPAMDTELLKTFLEVKNTRHFGRAAENLYLTQAAVSARIKQLESALGTQLFTRYRNNLQLTSAGERLTNYAEAMLQVWERARSDIALKKKQQSVFSIGGTSGLWDLILQDTLGEIHTQQPTLALRAEAHSQDVLIRRLMERTLDIALVYEPAKLTDIATIELSQANLQLVSTEKKQNALEAINKDFVAVDWGTAFDMAFAQSYQDTAPPVLHTSLAKTAMEFILKFGGAAYLPTRLTQPYLKKSLFVVDSAPSFKRPLYACYHQENRSTKVIEAVIGLIQNLLEQR